MTTQKIEMLKQNEINKKKEYKKKDHYGYEYSNFPP